MEWMEGDYRGAHLSNKGQKLLTVKAMQSVIFLVHKVWMFITPHIITEHSGDPEALRIPLTPYSISLSLPLSHTFAVFFSFSLSCWRWWKTGMHTGIIIHLKLLNMSWFGLSGTIMGTYKLKACWVEIPWIDAQKKKPRQCWKYENLVW